MQCTAWWGNQLRMGYTHSITLYFPTLFAEANDWPRGLATAYIAAMSNKSSESLLLLNTSSPNDGPSPAMHPRKDLFGVTDVTLCIMVTVSTFWLLFINKHHTFLCRHHIVEFFGIPQDHDCTKWMRLVNWMKEDNWWTSFLCDIGRKLLLGFRVALVDIDDATDLLHAQTLHHAQNACAP